MRRGNNPKRPRSGRPGSNRNSPQGNRSMDSHSAEGGRNRGNASQLFERYSTLARDAQSAGDRIASEGYLQYAEHYLRVLNAAQQGRGNGRAPGNGQDGKPEAAEGKKGNGGGGTHSAPDLAKSMEPAPEVRQSRPQAAEQGEASAEDADEDPLEPESAVN